ncbi:hypothetical protein RB195_021259 [Necator americanus]|uniref:Uncharacterized protein n=1 Tax=Necator americanus TaxID=51031 RepID=A0ABR1EB92_NECAM
MTRARNRTTRRNQPDPTLGKELRAQIRDRLKFMHQLEAALEEETDPDHVAALKDIMKMRYENENESVGPIPINC